MKREKSLQIKQSASYKMIHRIALWMDRHFLDPIIGLLLPGVGDALTSLCTLPYLYVSLCKIQSVPLTLAVLYNMLLDVLIGLIPYIGAIGDVFKRAFSRNAVLIEGYVEGNETIIREVDRKAGWMAFLIVVIVFLIYCLIQATVRIVEWVGSLF